MRKPKFICTFVQMTVEKYSLQPPFLSIRPQNYCRYCEREIRANKCGRIWGAQKKIRFAPKIYVRSLGSAGWILGIFSPKNFRWRKMSRILEEIAGHRRAEETNNKRRFPIHRTRGHNIRFHCRKIRPWLVFPFCASSGTIILPFHRWS